MGHTTKIRKKYILTYMNGIIIVILCDRYFKPHLSHFPSYLTVTLIN